MLFFDEQKLRLLSDTFPISVKKYIVL